MKANFVDETMNDKIKLIILKQYIFINICQNLLYICLQKAEIEFMSIKQLIVCQDKYLNIFNHDNMKKIF